MATGPGISGNEIYIDCRDLFKIYKRADLEVVALRGLNLAVRRGELIAIVGASGSGKSTLLNILAGLDRPSAGQVNVGDRDLLDVSERDLVRYRRDEVGFVWQATARNLVPYLSVADNIELPMALAGQPAKARHAWAGELLESLGMTARRDRFPHQLSGGEQQRVGIARALVKKPSILLADEPTGNLDSKSGHEIMGILDHLHSKGNTIILVTHEDDIAKHAKRTIRLFDGKIVEDNKGK